MYTLWSYYQSRQKRSMVERTAGMDPKERSGLAAHIEETNLFAAAGDKDQDVADLDRALQDCRDTLTKFEETERFLSTRLSSYRKQLDARVSDHRRHTNTNNNNGHTNKKQQQQHAHAKDAMTDEEAPDQEALFRDTQQTDEAALAKVRTTQLGILADMETLRRRIQDLEQKRTDILDTRRECREFLVAVAVAEEQEAVEELQQTSLQQQRKREKELNVELTTTTGKHNDDPQHSTDNEAMVEENEVDAPEQVSN
eukprot:scaffold284200_cov48-Attheya_sp.AAC.2